MTKAQERSHSPARAASTVMTAYWLTSHVPPHNSLTLHVSPHKAASERRFAAFGRFLWLCAEKRSWIDRIKK